MYQLNYYSISKENLTVEDLDDILTHSTSANSKKNITGCLIYHREKFVQILEGDKKDVCDIFKKIKADQRHHSATLLWENEVDSRCFENWNMAYHQPQDENVKEFVDNLLLLSELSYKSSASLLTFWATVNKILNGKTIVTTSEIELLPEL